MWSDHEHQVYSARTDLSPETFALLVALTVERRKVVIRENALELWERDQRVLEAAIRASQR